MTDRERQTERDRQIKRDRERETEREIDRQTETDRLTDAKKQRERERGLICSGKECVAFRLVRILWILKLAFSKSNLCGWFGFSFVFKLLSQQLFFGSFAIRVLP